MRPEPVKQIGVRLPHSLWVKLALEAKVRDESISDLVRDAIELFLDDITPGHCSYCHTHNSPDARYCQKCGHALTEDTKKEDEVMRSLIEEHPDIFKVVADLLKKEKEKT